MALHRMKKFIALLIVLLIVYMSFFSEEARLDREVDRLCAIDGGIKVYETVTLPPEKFDKYGLVEFYNPGQREDTLGPEYIYQWDIHYYKKGHPASQGAHITVMKRDHIKITRKSDMKLMGEVVMYQRGGGDLPGPWMPSSYHCPDRQEANEGILMHRIFIKSSERSGK